MSGKKSMMLEFPVICASFFPIIMLMAEGKGITSVFSLPLDRLRFLGCDIPDAGSVSWIGGADTIRRGHVPAKEVRELRIL